MQTKRISLNNNEEESAQHFTNMKSASLQKKIGLTALLLIVIGGVIVGILFGTHVLPPIVSSKILRYFTFINIKM